MADITPQQVTEAGPDAIALMIGLMQRNSAENGKIALSLYDAVQRDLDEARATIGRIRGNVLSVLDRPHTDRMVADALYADFDYETDGPA